MDHHDTLENMAQSKQITMDNCAVIDMFCGVGGLTHGFIREGFNVVAGYDLDSSCRYAYETNNKGAVFKEKDITNVTADEISNLYAKYAIKILVGCAPCQPFSTYSRKRVRKDDWSLLNEFGRIVREVKPEIVSIENVPEIARASRFTVFKDFLHLLDKEGYFVSWKIVKCERYGVPQARSRLVLLASRLGEIELIPETHGRDEYKTVKQTIYKLPKLKAGKSHKKDKLHVASGLTMKNLQRIQASQPGGTWKDWDDNLRASCHTTENGESYIGVYGRMEWDRPAPTITTQFYNFGSGRFGHPVQDRAISIREGAMLQTFPKNYKFIPPSQKVIITHLGRHIGNAVPVRLAQIVARSIKRHLEGIDG
jgi:DNA (cytosine-5)-methyltransferase 1